MTWKRVLLALLAGVALYVAWLAWQIFGPADPLPAALPPIAEKVDVAAIALPGIPQSDLETRTVFLQVVDPKALMAQEGGRLLARVGTWTLPDDVRGYLVASAPSLPQALRPLMERMLGAMKDEMPFPMAIDWGGAVGEALKLPKGHASLVVLHAGEVRLRISGEPTEAEVEAIRRELRAQLPPPPREAPFDVPRADKAQALVFYGHDFDEEDLPELKMDRSMSPAMPPSDPTLRLASFVRSVDTAGTEPKVGDPKLRAALGVPAGETALFVVDAQHRLAFEARGRIPMWRLGAAADMLGWKPAE